MAFLKNIFNALTDTKKLTEPKIYKAFNDKSDMIQNLTQLAESNDAAIDQKKVENHLKLFMIGQSGEKNVFFELQNSMLPMVVLHDVYLEFENYNAQLDFVIITHKFVLVLEVKKLFGNINVTDRGEFHRIITKNNRIVNKEGMYSPINQVERHVSILEKLLQSNVNTKKCPIKYVVTFANPKTIIDISKNAPANIQESVIRYDQIKTFIKNELDKKSTVSMTDQQLFELADTILKYSKTKAFKTEDYMLDTQPVESLNLTSNMPNDSSSIIDGTLKAALIEFRTNRAKETERKPFYIFTNKMLDSLIEKKPLTIDQLLEIEGFGPKKVEAFGEDILAIISKNRSNAEIPTIQHAEEIQVSKPSTKMTIEGQTTDDVRLALTTYRSRRAKEMNMKPYYIFNNSTLEYMLEMRPSTIDELLKIEGIGVKKAEEFGQEILSILNGYIENN
ncbi:HRDC domain-containing protein [Ureibacillus chungkukjangi]|uniref:HRDC domain-containing protein n=1 Tax=Ureibacillus chungkukjangi TaxID=1202712 RepID=UPI00203A3E95|nr:HRDC domain-containing protein [Ureibacillus chungkukjangi]MCM3386857.1 HRDC domain-containing protein [Ureibacillus chungkukjangi]